MKLRILLFAALMAMPKVVSAQATAKPAEQQLKATFDKMQAEVAKITDVSEKERWQANTALWQVKIARTGRLDQADLAKMQASLDTMKANVARLTGAAETAEKERWLANCELWQRALLQTGRPADIDTMKASLARMKTNVATITDATEKTRWQANHNLWQAVVK